MSLTRAAFGSKRARSLERSSAFGDSFTNAVPDALPADPVAPHSGPARPDPHNRSDRPQETPRRAAQLLLQEGQLSFLTLRLPFQLDPPGNVCGVLEHDVERRVRSGVYVVRVQQFIARRLDQDREPMRSLVIHARAGKGRCR